MVIRQTCLAKPHPLWLILVGDWSMSTLQCLFLDMMSCSIFRTPQHPIKVTEYPDESSVSWWHGTSLNQFSDITDHQICHYLWNNPSGACCCHPGVHTWFITQPLQWMLMTHSTGVTDGQRWLTGPWPVVADDSSSNWTTFHLQYVSHSVLVE